MTHVHDWHETGKRDVHVEFVSPKTGQRRQCFAVYLWCACGQRGFRRPHSRVVYTWRRD